MLKFSPYISRKLITPVFTKLPQSLPLPLPLPLLQNHCYHLGRMSASTVEKDIGVKGEFKRKESAFRKWITKDGSSGFPAESGRYHLYVSLACPWAHRTLIARQLKGLTDSITVDVVEYFMGPNSWTFNPEVPGATPDTVNGCKSMREVYTVADGEYKGRTTVPVLWDKKTNKIVSNESSEILRMLNSEFNEFCATEEQRKLDLYPEGLREEIDQLNEWIYK